MTFSLKPHHLKLYKDILRLLMKYGHSDLTREITADELETDAHPREPGKESPPEELVDDLEKMGPTFVKLGQLLSSRADLLPEPYLQALARLQDRVKPFPAEQAEQIVENELGARLSKAFSWFDPEPMAAASLGQVHRAALRDQRPVVVKVQRPGIRQQIAEDFAALEKVATLLDEHTEIGRRYRFSKLLDEFKTALAHELDYEHEAANLVHLAANMAEFPRLRVPLPIQDYTTRSVLTMDYIRGTKITQLSPLSRLDIDGPQLAEELFRAYLKQVLVDGLFHADPHPGNVFLTDDGRIALLDLGMVGRTTPGMREQLLKLLLAVSEGEGETAVEIVLRISQTSEEFDLPEFRRKIGQVVLEQETADLQRLNIGKALLRVGKISSDTGLSAPAELTLLGKTLLQLDQIGQILAPEFNPNESIRRNAVQLLRQQLWRSSSPARLWGPLLEAKDFVGGLPNRLNKILDALGNAELELKVKTPDAGHLLAGFQKIANRITMGIILAALIVSASLLMPIQTSFRLFGYPGLAILCFLLAASGGVCLVLSILIKDYKDRRKTRH